MLLGVEQVDLGGSNEVTGHTEYKSHLRASYFTQRISVSDHRTQRYRAAPVTRRADKMNRFRLVFLGALLFALHLASQVQAQGTMPPTAMPPTTMPPTTMPSTTNATMNVTTGNSTRDKSAGGRTEVSLQLLPLVLGVLYGWS